MTLPTSIHTIGHSRHPMEGFLALLRRHGIQTIVDVRSRPYSRWAPQFSRKTLARTLREAGIDYRFAGDALGGQPEDPDLYTEPGKQVDYARLAQTPAYRAAIAALVEQAESQPIALMCAEGDHTRCHRDHLIAQSLLEQGVTVRHIQRDGETVLARPLATQDVLLDTAADTERAGRPEEKQ